MKPHEHPELFPREAPKIAAEDVGKLLQILASSGWLTSREIHAKTGWPDRYLRALANASLGQVLSYPGSPGYKLTMEATKEEVDAADILAHQANAMRRRLIEIRNVFYGRRAVRSL